MGAGEAGGGGGQPEGRDVVGYAYRPGDVVVLSVAGEQKALLEPGRQFTLRRRLWAEAEAAAWRIAGRRWYPSGQRESDWG